MRIVKTIYQGGNPNSELRHSFGAIRSDPNLHRLPLRVTVVHTTTEGTIAALRTAADLAKGLGAEVVLLSAEEVPPQFPLDKLPVPVDLLERRLHNARLRFGDSGKRGCHSALALPQQIRIFAPCLATRFCCSHRREQALVVKTRPKSCSNS